MKSHTKTERKRSLFTHPTVLEPLYARPWRESIPLILRILLWCTLSVSVLCSDMRASKPSDLSPQCSCLFPESILTVESQCAWLHIITQSIENVSLLYQVQLLSVFLMLPLRLLNMWVKNNHQLEWNDTVMECQLSWSISWLELHHCAAIIASSWCGCRLGWAVTADWTFVWWVGGAMLLPCL